jgi:xanthine dehydrogenase YagT iron-sulfur-binding subunit
VLIDDRRVVSCLTLALAAEGQEITTIEGLATDDHLHPMQQAFVDNDAFQCGYCTPGQIMSAVACVKEGHAGSEADIREYMSGNICRCAAYPNIVAAVKQAAPDRFPIRGQQTPTWPSRRSALPRLRTIRWRRPRLSRSPAAPR